jgi:hypothetical protein
MRTEVTDLLFWQTFEFGIAGFFQDIFSLNKYFIFQNWQHLIDFMLYGSPAHISTNSS